MQWLSVKRSPCQAARWGAADAPHAACLAAQQLDPDTPPSPRCRPAATPAHARYVMAPVKAWPLSKDATTEELVPGLEPTDGAAHGLLACGSCCHAGCCPVDCLLTMLKATAVCHQGM